MLFVFSYVFHCFLLCACNNDPMAAIVRMCILSFHEERPDLQRVFLDKNTHEVTHPVGHFMCPWPCLSGSLRVFFLFLCVFSLNSGIAKGGQQQAGGTKYKDNETEKSRTKIARNLPARPS